MANEAPTIMANMKRSATKTVLFAFFINPILACSIFWCIAIYPKETMERVLKPIFWIAIINGILAFSAVPMWAYISELNRLERLGITLESQRVPGRRMWDWCFNIAVCVIVWRWSTKVEEENERRGDDVTDWIKIGLMFFAMWLGITLFLLGQIWYFAAEAPPAPQQQADRVQ